MLRLSESQAAKMGLHVPKKKRGKPAVFKPAVSPHLFPILCLRYGLPAPVTEYRFADGRKFAFDYAWPSLLVALEVEGGVWTQGRHTRGKGFLKDVAKYNLATTIGWRVIRCTPADVKSGQVFGMLKGMLPMN